MGKPPSERLDTTLNVFCIGTVLSGGVEWGGVYKSAHSACTICIEGVCDIRTRSGESK